MEMDITWLIGGPQGSGVESAANIFSLVCARLGYHVFGKREFYSNIKGEHSYFAVRISDRPIRSSVSNSTLMVSYDAETIFRHGLEVARGGAIIYDSDLAEVRADDIHTLDAPFRDRLAKTLESAGLPQKVSSILEMAEGQGIELRPVSFRSILADLARTEGEPRLKNMTRMFNVIGVSLAMGLLRMPTERLLESIDSIFSKKPRVAQLNRQAAGIAHRHASELAGFGHSVGPIPKRPHTILAQGFQGTALGKVVSGCRFQPYYPITPASDESVYLESHEILEVPGSDPGSTIVVQTEDEISAIGMTIGAAVAGSRSATCTSGPGFSLMAEALGWAGINEVPIVVTNYQRSGPSTGLPTRHGQDDLLFAIHAGHGEFPRIVYASGDIEESFYDTARCFNYADVYQVPVIHLMDKFLASSTVTCQRFDPELVEIDRGKLLERIERDDYRRFEQTSDGISPRSKLGLENGIFWNTGDESDEYGHITEDPVTRVEMMDKRMGRLDRILQSVPDEDQAVSFGVSEHTVVSWGSAKGPVVDAILMLQDEGIKVGFVQIKMLHPFPSSLVDFLLKDAKTIIDVEANHSGQLGKILRQNTGREPDYYILKYSGRIMTCTEIYNALKRIIAGVADKREVLMHGA
jgi:2-oxoglutarate ferredoxin oxidoreductase subunit alpha